MSAKKEHHTPRKRWGQNFLTDLNMAKKIVQAIQTPPPRFLWEIGPGKGVLTQFLIETGDPYMGIEIDPQLVQQLREQWGQKPNVILVQEDILAFPWEAGFRKFPGHQVVVIGNIPYNITSPILFKLFEHSPDISEAILMVQKEVAERLIASPGSKAYGILGIMAGIHARVEYLFTVPSARFYPRPKVDSAVVRLTFRTDVLATIQDLNMFKHIVRISFQQRRKMLKNSLIPLLPEGVIGKLKIDWRRRPETVSIPEWIALSNEISQYIKEDR